jgi:peptide/nickel transport system permease protein
MKRLLLRLTANPAAAFGAAICSVVVILVAIAPLLWPYALGTMNFEQMLAAPTWAHPFGTDSYGRDVFVRVLAGAKLSLTISLSGVLLAAIAGIASGTFAGMHEGLTGAFLMRLSDLIFSFPSFVLALFLVVVFGFGTQNIIFAIALVYFPIFARLARNLTAVVKHDTYVAAAQVLGQSRLHVMLREILPNIAAPLLVQFTMGVAFGIVIEAGLSFIGLGVQPPRPSLGTIMADGREYFQRAPWVLTLTGTFVSVALLGLNLLGDGLRDLADPRLRP